MTQTFNGKVDPMPLLHIGTDWIDKLPPPGSERGDQQRALCSLARITNEAFNAGHFDLVDQWLSYFPNRRICKLLMTGMLRYSVCAVHRGYLPCFPLATWRVWLWLEDAIAQNTLGVTITPDTTPKTILRGLLNPGSTKTEDIMAEITPEQRNTARLANAFQEAWEGYHAGNGVAPIQGIRIMHTAPQNALGSKILVHLPSPSLPMRLALSTHPPTRRVLLEAEALGTKEWSTVLSADYFVECFALAGEWSPELQTTMIDVIMNLLGKLTIQANRAATLMGYISPFTAEIKTRAGVTTF